MVRYKMLGRDVNSSPTQYRTWMVNGQPDFAGHHFHGHKSGPLPLVDVSAYEIFDPNAVVDFNLPNALDWATTKRVLPEATYGSHLAIIGDFVYLFGGKSSSKIFRATLDNPADWKDTGARLPTALSGAQLAILDGYIYLFGGNNGEATDTIYSAPTSDPLTWTNLGSHLPIKLYDSQMTIVNGNIYLYGGLTINNSTGEIFTASVANPLAWTDTGTTLPVPLFGSQIAIIGTKIYLFGGLIDEATPINTIYHADVATPTTFTTNSFLPHAICNGQFFTIGNFGYLITPTQTPVTFTKILRCNLSAPQQWVDTLHTVPGEVSQSQVAIIYDRIWLFGGNGSSIIFANNSVLKYKLGSAAVMNYGFITRTVYNTTPNPLDLFRVLGFPNWKTDYGA